MLFQKLRQKADLNKISAFRSIEGWLTDQEALGLYRMARSVRKKGVVVEIGSWQGKSTYCLATGLRSGVVHAIDPFNGDAGQDDDSRREYEEKKQGRDLENVFAGNMKRLNVFAKIDMMKGYSVDFHQEIKSVDALFIDGDHSIAGCSMDFDLYAGKIIPGGFLAFHDYHPDFPNLGPTHVIQQLVLTNPHYQFYKRYDTLWIARRKS